MTAPPIFGGSSRVSRRKALFAGVLPAAAAIGAVVGNNSPDAELIRLCGLGVAAVREADRLAAPYATALDDPPAELEAACAALFARNQEIRERVATLRACTIEGLRAKAALEQALKVEERGADDVAWSILVDLTGEMTQ